MSPSPTLVPGDCGERDLHTSNTQLKMQGFTKLAALMADQPQYTVLPRFMTLRCYRLLHLTAELVQIADELGIAVEQDRNSDDPERCLFESWYEKLLTSRHDLQSAIQLEIWERLDSKLNEHGKALLMYQSLLHLPEVDKKHLEYLRSWLDAENGGNSFLHGSEAFIWDKGKEKDLTSLSAHQDQEKDLLTRFIQNSAIPTYHAVLGQGYKRRLRVSDPFSGEQMEMPIYEYSDKAITGIVTACSTTLASMIPALSTLALYFITDPLARIGAVIAFTFLFSVTLNLVTKAKRVECFAGTAAFSAVLVVFVSSNGPSQCACSQD